MITLIHIVAGLVIGISLVGLLSWKDDNYESPKGLLWIVSFVMSVSLAILMLIIPLKG